MAEFYYKTGIEIYEIIRFMKETFKLSCVASPSSLRTGQTYGSKSYRFSFFLNAQNKIVYLIEPLADDETDYEQFAKRHKSKEEKTMTKEEALKKIEELKAFVEKLDEEIPEMRFVTESNNSNEGSFCFNDKNTLDCYTIKVFELAHLMYAREHINHFGITNGPVWHLYFDADHLKYELIQPSNVRKYSDFTNLWVFINRDDATKVCNYMNKHVKDKVKELY